MERSVTFLENHEADYYEKLEENKVRCLLCPRYCTIQPSEFGNCISRKNIDGKLYALGYSRFTSVNDDPIEKKPIYHYKPGTSTMSFGTAGCNLHCDMCQNWTISQISAESNNMHNITSKHAIELVRKHNCDTIAYTYNEPLINFEWIRDTGNLAHENNFGNILVSNGLINKEPLSELIGIIDAANIDIKAFNQNFYGKIAHFPGLEQIKENVIFLYNEGVHIELTMLLIPGYNDNKEEIKSFAEWILNSLSEKVPVHFSRFYPHYKMQDVPPTPVETVLEASRIAEAVGIKYVYTGNLPYSEINSTLCQNCGVTLVERAGYTIKKKNLEKSGTCKKCGEPSDFIL
ncbi:MAG: AmmeMemoRadiSam system radical SAM enzyme [Candidatus Heimdallarchaeota archaeon]|nr:AmmeMemoRadiSam system radical SAM enzyme [Candidatus Heimdallarchaeota archaeon]